MGEAEVYKASLKHINAWVRQVRLDLERVERQIDKLLEEVENESQKPRIKEPVQ